MRFFARRILAYLSSPLYVNNVSAAIFIKRKLFGKNGCSERIYVPNLFGHARLPVPSWRCLALRGWHNHLLPFITTTVFINPGASFTPCCFRNCLKVYPDLWLEIVHLLSAPCFEFEWGKSDASAFSVHVILRGRLSFFLFFKVLTLIPDDCWERWLG